MLTKELKMKAVRKFMMESEELYHLDDIFRIILGNFYRYSDYRAYSKMGDEIPFYATHIVASQFKNILTGDNGYYKQYENMKKRYKHTVLAVHKYLIDEMPPLPKEATQFVSMVGGLIEREFNSLSVSEQEMVIESAKDFTTSLDTLKHIPYLFGLLIIAFFSRNFVKDMRCDIIDIKTKDQFADTTLMLLKQLIIFYAKNLTYELI